MPTRIVSTSSDSQQGRINIVDLTKITRDFETDIDVVSKTGRTINKVNFVSIPVLLIEHLLEDLTDEQKLSANVNIRFAITLPDQKDCVDGTTDASNFLTVALILEINENELIEEDNFVVTPGFKEENIGGGANAACCPVIKPGQGG